MTKFHKESFEKISEDKRQRILNVSISEFAARGFVAANINDIAKKAGISIGSLYNYFASKDDLYMAIADEGFRILEKLISTIDLSTGTVFDKIEKLVRATQEYSRKYPELTQIYHDLTSQSLSHMSARLSKKMEEITARYYRHIIADAKKEGLVGEDVNEWTAAFCLDNLFLVLQYSYTSKYFMERMKIFAGHDALDNDERIIKGVMRFIRGGLSPMR